MPPAIGKPCAAPGCSAIITKGHRCLKHRRQLEREDRQRNGSATQRGYDRKWRAYRETFLKRYPLCGEGPGPESERVGCLREGRVTPAVEVDHIIPRVEAPDLFWKPANHQALCRACHRAKCGREQKRREIAATEG